MTMRSLLLSRSPLDRADQRSRRAVVAYAMVGFKLERLEEGEGAEGVEPTPLAESLVLDTPHETSESR